MMWDWLIDKDELFFLGCYAVFCIACWSFIGILFVTLYVILSVCEWLNRKFWEFIERMVKRWKNPKTKS